MFKFERIVEDGVEKTFAKLSTALRNHKFVLLSYVDVQEIFKKNFEDPYKPFFIMEVCNPMAARELLYKDEDFGNFIPCKIVISEFNGKTKIRMPLVSDLSKGKVQGGQEIASKYEKELMDIISSL